jgi:hypothetical protein
LAKVAQPAGFYGILNAAIDDLLEYGFDSQERLDRWLKRLAATAEISLLSEEKLSAALQTLLQRTFKRATSDREILEVHPGVSAFTLRQVRPKLRQLLDQKIHASAGLIRLNREASIARTLQRFAGWASSVPAGGTEVGKRREVKKQIRRGIASLPFEERRVIIDQGHKLTAAINEVIAVDGGAIAGRWHHVKRGPPSYDARPEHVARDGKVYLLRGSWALQRGFVKPGSVGFSDQITQPGEEIFCSCWYEFIYALRDLPRDMLTAKGKEALLEARAAIRQIA